MVSVCIVPYKYQQYWVNSPNFGRNEGQSLRNTKFVRTAGLVDLLKVCSLYSTIKKSGTKEWTVQLHYSLLSKCRHGYTVKKVQATS